MSYLNYSNSQVTYKFYDQLSKLIGVTVDNRNQLRLLKLETKLEIYKSEFEQENSNARNILYFETILLNFVFNLFIRKKREKNFIQKTFNPEEKDPNKTRVRHKPNVKKLI